MIGKLIWMLVKKYAILEIRHEMGQHKHEEHQLYVPLVGRPPAFYSNQQSVKEIVRTLMHKTGLRFKAGEPARLTFEKDYDAIKLGGTD